MIYCFDLDGTLCTNTEGDYESARPQPWAIERVNALKRAGHRVVIFTARGTTTGIDWRPQTEQQLAEWGVEYDELLLGKPYADVYVDDKALHADAWRYGPAHELRGPGHAPLRSAAAVEVGRTFGGRPLYVREHAERLQARASGVSVTEIESAVAESTERAGELLDPDDDVVFSIAVEDPPSAAYLDTIDGTPGPELTVSCRLLSQPARALARLGGPASLRAATDGRDGAWPLRVAADGSLVDALGGTVEAVGADELLIIGMPFCILRVAELDGRPLRDSGARDRRLAEWSEECGVDLAGQLSKLAGS